MFFINILFLVNYTTQYLINNINSRLTISLNLKSSYTNENSEVIELISDIKSFNKWLEVNYISKEEAFWVLQIRDPELAKVIEWEKENPLPSSIVIKKIWLTQYESLDKIISKYKNIIIYDEEKSKKNITDYKAQYQRINDVIKIFTSIQYWIYCIIGFFIFSVFIIIYNTIWNFIFFYREEIKITKLVWWDNIFIYGPFSIQWLIYTFIASFLSLFIFIYIIKTINIYLIDDFPKFINDFLLSNYKYFLIEIIWLSLVWILSGFISSMKFINLYKNREK
jgi:cell division transport system permease protein